MPKGVIFWVLMILWAIFGFLRQSAADNKIVIIGNELLLFILLFILGWASFGFVVQ